MKTMISSLLWYGGHDIPLRIEGEVEEDVEEVRWQWQLQQREQQQQEQ